MLCCHRLPATHRHRSRLNRACRCCSAMDRNKRHDCACFLTVKVDIDQDRVSAWIGDVSFRDRVLTTLRLVDLPESERVWVRYFKMMNRIVDLSLNPSADESHQTEDICTLGTSSVGIKDFGHHSVGEREPDFRGERSGRSESILRRSGPMRIQRPGHHGVTGNRDK